MAIFAEQNEWSDQAFRNLVFKGGRIASKRFYHCSFTNCKFNETVFEACELEDCSFKNCDFSLARVPKTSFSNVKFENSKVIGVNWTEALCSTKGRLKKHFFDFTDCVLNYSVFMGLKLEGMTLSKCVALEVNFEGADLTRANCTETDFSASRFVRTNLTEANFTRATNYAINTQENTLHKTRFSLPEAVSLLRSLDIILEGDSIENP